MTLMPTYEAMGYDQREIVKAMSDAARGVLMDWGIHPLNDDRAAIFDEACAIYMKESKR